MAIFVDRTDKGATRAATEAEMSACVVDGLRKDRITSTLDAAATRFHMIHGMRSELETTKAALAARKTIDRAKGLSEDEACGHCQHPPSRSQPFYGKIIHSRMAPASACAIASNTRSPCCPKAPLTPMIECESAQFLIHCACEDNFIAFDIPLGISDQHLAKHGLVARSIHSTDTPDGHLYLGQLKGRALSVAVAKFADQLVQALEN